MQSIDQGKGNVAICFMSTIVVSLVAVCWWWWGAFSILIIVIIFCSCRKQRLCEIASWRHCVLWLCHPFLSLTLFLLATGSEAPKSFVKGTGNWKRQWAPKKFRGVLFCHELSRQQVLLTCLLLVLFGYGFFGCVAPLHPFSLLPPKREGAQSIGAFRTALEEGKSP